MVKLLDDGNNILTRVQSTDAIMAGFVLKSAKKQADELLATTGKTVLPTFTTQTEAQEEADWLNVINQSVIGAKESVVEAVLKLVGRDITDAILRTADGSDHKSINDFTLYQVIKVAINGADRPSTNDTFEQFLEVINHTFDFRKKVSVDMELMQSHTASTYGIVMGIPQLMLTLLANIETATKANYGCEFCLAMHAIRKKYTSLQTILTELAGVNRVRVLKDAPAPNAGTARSVANSLSFLNSMMMNGNIDSKYIKSAYRASSNSSSSEEQRKSRDHKHKKSKKPKSCRNKKKEKNKDDKPKKNTWLHCKKYHRKKSHRVELDTCIWNKKYKGYRFKLICDELEVDFKPHIKFTADLGGYAEKDDLGSE